MKGFRKVDMQNWDRREIYDYFQGTVMYNTVHMDISDFLKKVKGRGLRFYPAIIHCLLRVVNAHECFRYAYGEDGSLGILDEIHALYTVPRGDNPQLFSMGLTEYDEDFAAFYARFEADYALAQGCEQLLSKPARQDAMGITAMPGLHFSAFAFGDAEAKKDLLPFVVLGEYQLRQGAYMLPVFGEFVHSVNDGYHISLFYNELENALGRF